MLTIPQSVAIYFAVEPVDMRRGHDGLAAIVRAQDCGDNIAGLYSLVATCEANGVNPLTYLSDVLVRIQTHPVDRIDELLPHRWKPPTT